MARKRLSRSGLGAAAVVVLVLGGAALVALWSETREDRPSGRGAYQRHPAAPARPDTELPDYAQTTPVLGELYRFAVARPDVLAYIPCTCGCRGAGHYSNWNCYVRSIGADGTVVFDDMAPT